MRFSVCPIFYIEKSLLLGAINHCFDNKSQTDPSPCDSKYDFMYDVKISFTIPKEHSSEGYEQHSRKQKPSILLGRKKSGQAYLLAYGNHAP